MIQIWERPYCHSLDSPQLGFDTFGSTLWLAVMAIGNLGVTPPFPSTTMGRALTLTANVIGLVVFSLLIGVVDKIFRLDNNQIQTLAKIAQNKLASRSIKSALQYNVYK